MDYIQLFFATSPPFIIYPNNLLTNPLSNKMHLSNHLFMPIEKMLNKHLKKKNMLGIHIDVEKEQQYVI